MEHEMSEHEALAYEIEVRQNPENITHEGWEIVVNALLKQVPKKPKEYYIDSTNRVNWMCQCGICFKSTNDELPLYCSECGQRFDFSDC